MIALSAVSFDPQGHVVLRPRIGSNVNEISRRVNRVATLDGGAVVNDRGYSAGDRTFRILWDLRSSADYDAVRRLLVFHGLLTVACRDGVFRATPSYVNRQGKVGELELLITEEMT